MSGMKRLAAAIAQDPSFAKQAGMSTGEAAQFVGDGKGGVMTKGVSRPAAPAVTKGK